MGLSHLGRVSIGIAQESLQAPRGSSGQLSGVPSAVILTVVAHRGRDSGSPSRQNRSKGTQMKKLHEFTALVEREGDGYVALCPEFDVASQGDTVEEARQNLAEAVAFS